MDRKQTRAGIATLFGVELPIIQAPMAGVQAQTSKPFNVSFFCHAQPAPDAKRSSRLDQTVRSRYTRATHSRNGHSRPDADRVGWRDMSKIGDIVFCVDCDLARSAHLKVAVGDRAGAPNDLPRHMATKKDANGDTLCRACLDARVQRRRAEFLQPVARSDRPQPQASVSWFSGPTAAAPRNGGDAKPVDTSARRLSSVRIERVRPMPIAKSPLRKPLDKKRVVSETLAEVHRASERASKARALKLSARSLQLAAAEIGLLRAHELLAEIRAAALEVTGRTR
jgi:hypothetical protein